MGKLPIDGEPLLYRIFLNKGVPSRCPIGPFVLIPGPTRGPNIIGNLSDWGKNYLSKSLLAVILMTFSSKLG